MTQCYVPVAVHSLSEDLDAACESLGVGESTKEAQMYERFKQCLRLYMDEFVKSEEPGWRAPIRIHSWMAVLPT